MENETEKKCPKCKLVKSRISDFYHDRTRSRGISSACKVCYNKKRELKRNPRSTRSRRIANIRRAKRYRLNNKDKVESRKIYNKALKSGELIRKPCVKCGEKAHGHHPDYSKPLEVMWLCRKHHLEEHNGKFSPSPEEQLK